MNESTNETKQDSYEDSSSSGDWTFVDGSANIKETNNLIKKEINKKDLNEPVAESPEENEEPTINEHIEEIKRKLLEDSEEEEVEKGEEAGEKDIESDDVSVISDEEPEHTTYEEKRIEKFEPTQLGKCSSPQPKQKSASLPAITLLILSISAFILTIMTFSFMYVVNMRLQSELSSTDNKNDKNTNTCVFEVDDDLQSAYKFRQNLEDLHEVIDGLDNLKYKVPEIQKLINDVKDGVTNFIRLKLTNENTFDHISNKIEMLAVLYESYCTVFVQLSDISADPHGKTCEIPDVLHDMILFEKKWPTDLYDYVNNKEVLVLQGGRNEIIAAINEDKKTVDDIAENLLSDFLIAFSTFSTQFEAMKEIHLKSEQILKNIKNIENNNSKREIKTSDKEVFQRSKGEVKNDWKRNKYESKDKQSFEERKYNKKDKNENYKKNNNNKKFKYEREYDDSRESYEKDYQKYKNKKESKYNEAKESVHKDYDNGNKDGIHEYQNKKIKKENEYKRKFENKKVPDHDNKSEHEKNYVDQKFDYDKKEKYNQEYDYKNYCKSGHKCDKKKYHDDDVVDDDDDDDDNDDDEQIDLENDMKNLGIHPGGRGSYDYMMGSGHRWDNNWLERRSSYREKQRNSDWYSARADSRQWARTEEDKEKLSKSYYIKNSPLQYRPRKNRFGRSLSGRW